MFQKFTDNARKVMALANQQAQQSRHKCILAEHILIELLKEESGTGCKVLKNLGVDIKKMLLEAETLTKSGQENVHTAEPPNIPGARQVIEHAAEEARSLKDNYIGTGHILLALLRQSEGITARVLKAPGLKYEDVRQEIINLSGMEVD